MDASSVLVGINAGDFIQQGNFFRLTFGQYGIFGLTELASAFQRDMQNVFDKLDAQDGLAQPVSDLAVAPGDVAAVFDVLIRPAAIGVTAAYLANYFNELDVAIKLTSMTLIDSQAAINGTDERSTLQGQLSDAAKKSNPLAVFGEYAKYVEWTLVLALVVLLLYFGQKAVKVAKDVL